MSTTNALPYTLHFVTLANAAKALNVPTPELTAVLRTLTPHERRDVADEVAKEV